MARKSYLAYKKTKNNRQKINSKTKRNCFKEVTKEGTMTNEKFWTTFKSFLTNKGNFSNDSITIEKDGELISN